MYFGAFHCCDKEQEVVDLSNKIHELVKKEKFNRTTKAGPNWTREAVPDRKYYKDL